MTFLPPLIAAVSSGVGTAASGLGAALTGGAPAGTAAAAAPAAVGTGTVLAAPTAGVMGSLTAPLVGGTAAAAAPAAVGTGTVLAPAATAGGGGILSSLAGAAQSVLPFNGNIAQGVKDFSGGIQDFGGGVSDIFQGNAGGLDRAFEGMSEALGKFNELREGPGVIFDNTSRKIGGMMGDELGMSPEGKKAAGEIFSTMREETKPPPPPPAFEPLGILPVTAQRRKPNSRQLAYDSIVRSVGY